MASWKFVHALLLGLVAVAALHSIFLFRYYYEFCFGKYNFFVSFVLKVL